MLHILYLLHIQYMGHMKKSEREQCFKDGYEAFGKFSSAPHSNPDFMNKVPNCQFGDDKGTKLRRSMFKEYIKGWTTAHLKSMVI